MKQGPRAYIKMNVGIDATKLSESDALKLAQWINAAIADQLPGIARSHREEYGIPERSTNGQEARA